MIYNLDQFNNNHIKLIHKLDKKNLQETIYNYVQSTLNINTYNNNTYSVRIITFAHYNPTLSKVRYSFNNEIYDFLNKQNLRWYLGIEASYFNCIMHKDKNKSASIYQKDDGDWIYKCFSPDCPFKIGDINKVTECLTKLNRPDTLDFLKYVYGIVLEKNEWQIEQEKIIDSNIELLMNNVYIKSNYPELYKRIKNYIPQLVILHEFAKRNLTLEEAMNSKYVTFSAPIRQLSESLIKMGNSGSLQSISVRNNILVFIGMLLKISDDMIVPGELEQLKEYAKSQGWDNYKNFYALPSYNYESLNSAEQKSIEFKETGMTVQAFGREMISRSCDEEDLKKTYPRQQRNNMSGLIDSVGDILKEEIFSYLESEGYCLEKKIINNGYLVKRIKNKFKIDDPVKMNKKVVAKIYRIILPELVRNYGITRCRLNAKLKEQLKVKVKGSPNVLINNELKFLNHQNKSVDN